jgi:prepilin-type N-terminal cleavage/methylation domain-containing protein/prepilin-type processing-associated H-X9-DG protein
LKPFGIPRSLSHSALHLYAERLLWRGACFGRDSAPALPSAAAGNADTNAPAENNRARRDHLKRTGKGGFTLIELLVVIAIIAILAAILFPVFAKARGRAKQIACMSNVKQLSTAFITYFQDNDDRFPPYAGVQTWGDHQGWSERVFPYVKNMEVYRCPENELSTFCYTMNAISSSSYLGQTTRVRNPARFIHLCECAGSGNRKLSYIDGDSDLTTENGTNLPADNQQDGQVYGAVTYLGHLTYTPVANAMPIRKYRDIPGRHWGRLYFPGWHSGGNNVMFLDGHVKFFLGWSDGNMTFNDYKN